MLLAFGAQQLKMAEKTSRGSVALFLGQPKQIRWLERDYLLRPTVAQETEPQDPEACPGSDITSSEDHREGHRGQRGVRKDLQGR